MLKKYAGIDVQAWYPAHPADPGDLQGLDLRHAAQGGRGLPQGRLPVRPRLRSSSTDANQTWGATFGAFGADLVDAKGNITVDSDNVRAVMEYCSKTGEVHAGRHSQLR